MTLPWNGDVEKERRVGGCYRLHLITVGIVEFERRLLRRSLEPETRVDCRTAPEIEGQLARYTFSSTRSEKMTIHIQYCDTGNFTSYEVNREREDV